MKDLGVTKGTFEVRGSTIFIAKTYDSIASVHRQSSFLDKLEDTKAKANANLVVDAFNTAQECGLLPSELLQQRNELFEALKELTALWNKVHTDKVLLGKPTLDAAKQTIANIEKTL